nr:zinc finger protein 512 [Anolis sagrei ordinatus]
MRGGGVGVGVSSSEGYGRGPGKAQGGPRKPRPPPEAAGRVVLLPEAMRKEAPSRRKVKQVPAGRQAPPEPKGRRRKREPPPYPPGSLEEQWQLAILGKGRVTCPICRAATRKTVEGLRKHMANCQQEVFTCHHCGKQLRSLAGMKYHLMADHNSLLTGKETEAQDKQSQRERLRQVLKRLGKLKCTREGCSGSFTSIVGYLYHTQKCGKAAEELETLVARCPHCGKAYRSKAGLVYHLKSEHGPAPFHREDNQAGAQKDAGSESSGGRRLQRKSAKVAAYYLHELAHVELAKEWPKRKVLQDLVPDDRKLKYTRPGLPTVSQEVLCKWRAEIKAYRQVQCPNQVRTVPLGWGGGSCQLGEFVAGKYRCLLCSKEFVSESGVKYHINTVHSEDWFDMDATVSRGLAKRRRSEEPSRSKQRQHRRKPPSRSRKRRPPAPRALSPKRPPRPGPDPCQASSAKAGRMRGPPGSGGEGWSAGHEAATVVTLPLKLSHKRSRK